jgi:hypothetical protein
MKYLIILLLTASCLPQVKLKDHYVKAVEGVNFIEYKKSEENFVQYREFKAKIDNKDLNQIMYENSKFAQKHQVIGVISLEVVSHQQKQITKEQLEKFAKEIGAKYTYAYRFYKAYKIKDDGDNAVIAYTTSNDISYYLIYFFADYED